MNFGIPDRYYGHVRCLFFLLFIWLFSANLINEMTDSDCWSRFISNQKMMIFLPFLPEMFANSQNFEPLVCKSSSLYPNSFRVSIARIILQDFFWTFFIGIVMILNNEDSTSPYKDFSDVRSMSYFSTSGEGNRFHLNKYDIYL